MALHAGKNTFVVPVTAGQYAPERIQFNSQSAADVQAEIRSVTALVESTVATAVVELWLLKANADPSVDANYVLHGTIVTATGGATVSLAGWRGAQIRVKSGGTAGSMIVSAVAN